MRSIAHTLLWYIETPELANELLPQERFVPVEATILQLPLTRMPSPSSLPHSRTMISTTCLVYTDLLGFVMDGTFSVTILFGYCVAR